MSRETSRKTTPRRSSGAWLALGFLCLAALAGAWGWQRLSDPALMPVRQVAIHGRVRHVDVKALQKALAEVTRAGFFGVDLAEVQRIVQARPWVAAARVRRVWPDRLVVEIREQRPVARWGRRGLVNERGEVFEPAKKVRLALPVTFEGPRGAAGRMLAFYRQVAPAFEKLGLKVQKVRLDPRGEWRLGLSGGLEVVAGRERMKARIRRLVAVWPLLAEPARRPQRIDLRYEQGFAVRWRPEEQS